MRAVRFAVELDFEIELDTRRAIEKMAGGLEEIAKERIRDELEKMIMARNAAKGILLLEELDLLRYVLPELREGLGVGQNKHHVYSVFEHSVKSLDYTAKAGIIRSRCVWRRFCMTSESRASKVGDGPDSTFYQHEYISAKMAVRALDRLRFPKDFMEQVAHLVRRHMFYYNVGEISPAGRAAVRGARGSGKYRRSPESARSRSHRLWRRKSGTLQTAPSAFHDR